MNEIVITPDLDGVRIDRVLSSEEGGLSRTQSVKIIESGLCRVNGIAVLSKRSPVREGDVVLYSVPEAESADIRAEKIPLDVVYEDESVIIVNKPKGMVVHPAPGHTSGTLVNALMYHCGDSLSGINGILRPGIVHRLDRDTGGLVIAAKSDLAHVKLAEQLSSRSMLRQYEAVVHGRFKSEIGERVEVNAPIGRSVSDRKRMCVSAKENAREAVTVYSVVAEYDKFTHLRLELKTGRTHQIRVHMAYLNHAVAGDCVYGNGSPAWLGSQCLYARRVGFVHPLSGEYMEVSSELPDYFKSFLESL